MAMASNKQLEQLLLDLQICSVALGLVTLTKFAFGHLGKQHTSTDIDQGMLCRSWHTLHVPLQILIPCTE